MWRSQIAVLKAIENWSLRICKWPSSRWGGETNLPMTNFQLPIVNQRFRIFVRSETALFQRALAKSEVIYARILSA
jgi:hypothetical protein